jgi:hypothetical protein
MIKVNADGGGEGTGMEESELLEGLREHADVLEVNNPDFVSRGVEEKVVLGDVRVIDAAII